MSPPRSLFIGICLTIFLHLSNAAAIPTTGCGGSTATPTVPLNNGATDLPSTNLTLAYVAIGRGVQNYTCAAPSATPVAVGAIATLYDATSLARYSEESLHTLPPKLVYLPVPEASFFTSAGIFPILGHHYFDAAGTPTFDLTAVGKIFYGAKTGDIKAPASADKGPAGTGAVDWLQLSQKTGYTSKGVQVTYRVVTAGGVAPACTSAGSISVQYAAEYWYFN